MTFLWALTGVVIGAIFAAIFGDGDAAVVLGMVTGGIAGALLARMRALERRLSTLERMSPIADAPSAIGHASATVPLSSVSEPLAAQTGSATAIDPTIGIDIAPLIADAPPVPAMQAITMSAEIDGAPETATSPPGNNDPLYRFFAAIKRWFSEGNVPVKVGMLVLFAGIAALLKYVADAGWLNFPIEFRLAGIAFAALAALVFGWRQRGTRRVFALSLQGGAIGVLLLTVFAAFRLYGLLPPTLAFGLMIMLVAGVGMLAVLQDALALAVLGILAGFAAPILISTGSANHATLFTYYAVLNIAVFAIAWLRPWRGLNLLGFAFTYAIGTAWGVLRYEPELFAATAPFLLLYFAIYLVIPIAHASQTEKAGAAPGRHGVIDGTLVFGNPLVAFALYAGMLRGDALILAFSALLLAAVYATLAWALLRRSALRVLGESFAILSVGFATLAVPLALDARATAAVFALEGAALIWLGWRQQRRLPRWSGLALQLLAAASLSLAMVFSGAQSALAWINGNVIGALLIAAAGLISAWLYLRAQRGGVLALLLYLWGLLWWLIAGANEIDAFAPATAAADATLGLFALTALLAGEAHARWQRAPLAWTVAIALLAALPLAIAESAVHDQPFAHWGALAWVAYAAFGWRALSCLRSAVSATAIAHAGWIWAWTLTAALVLDQFAETSALGEGWRIAVPCLALLAATWLTLRRPNAIAPPLRSRFDGYRPGILLSQMTLIALMFVFALFGSGASVPIAYVPLLNPLELALLAFIGIVAAWLSDAGAPHALAAKRAAILAGSGFVFVTDATLRAVHHWSGAPWDAQLPFTTPAQTSLTVVWSVLGVAGWIIGSRRGKRALWLAGALLMGIVLAKLLLIDRHHLGNLYGIGSFIAFGLLCTVIGYFAPAPARVKAGDIAP